MAIDLMASNGEQDPYMEYFFADMILRHDNIALAGAYISTISVYELILSETILQEELNWIVGKCINDNIMRP